MATILAVDDRAINREFLTMLLTHQGHRVLEAGDGADALAVMRATPVDLVVSDILMPTMDGYELVRRMRETPATALVPVMFFTAHYNEREARGLAEACGVSRVLTKPADPAAVLAAIDQVLANKVPIAVPPQEFEEQHVRVVNDKLVATTGELRRQAGHMAALIEINLQLASERDPQRLLSGFCRAARDLVAARNVVVAVHRADQHPLHYVTVSGMEEQVAAKVEAALMRNGAFADLIGNPRSFRRRIDGDPTMAGLPCEHPAAPSLAVAPIRSLSHVYGWICATGKLGLPAFTEEDEHLLATLAAQVGRIYENGSLNAELQQQADDLRREVAERRLAEAALVQSEKGFRYLFQNSPLPMAVFSVTTLRFLEVNDAAIVHYGYSRNEFLAMTLKDIRPPEEVREPIQSSPIDNFHLTGRRHRHKDGRILDIELFLSDIQFESERARLAVIIDVTERRKAERQAERIFETSQDVILVTDGYGTLLEVSPSSAKVLGYSPEEMVGRNAGVFISPDDLEATRNEMRTARRGSVIRNFKSRYVHKDGRVVSLVWMAVWSEPDRKHFFMGRDMTDYERSEAQLRQAQKMEAVGQLTGGIAHDFNNLLTVILANADALQEEPDLDPAALTERLEQIAQAVLRASELTRQLLAFSRKQALLPKPTDLTDLVAGTGKLLRRALGEHIEIDTVFADGLWTINIDRAQLETALVNLCVNARDAMPNGGRLLIETRNVTWTDTDVGLSADAAPGDYILLAVSDTGCGMSRETVEKVFEPFFTTKEVGKGTGLGLSMVYGFVKQSNGHIVVESEVGQGTTFKLYLPRSDGQRDEMAVREATATPRGTEKILVVEDEPQVLANVVQQLQGLGYAVSQAVDAKSGIACFEAALSPYDLLLTDIVMPGLMNGKGLADEVIRRWPSTKVVFVTGYARNAVLGDLDSGVFVLSKPFRKSDLAQIIRRALDGC
jgi:PAS domain S-box-containing protein